MATDTGGQVDTAGFDTTFMITRARELDLGGSFKIPAGDPVTHHGAGFAKIMASNVFLSGFEPAFVAQHNGFFTAPLAERKHVLEYDIDQRLKTVNVNLSNGITRKAKLFGSQGAVTLPLNAEKVFFQDSIVVASLDEQHTCNWPDVGLDDLPRTIDADKLNEALDLAFDDEAMSAAFLVTYKGNIIAERYGPYVGIQTPLEVQRVAFSRHARPRL